MVSRGVASCYRSFSICDASLLWFSRFLRPFIALNPIRELLVFALIRVLPEHRMKFRLLELRNRMKLNLERSVS